jgi:hypothetical protein
MTFQGQQIQHTRLFRMYYTNAQRLQEWNVIQIDGVPCHHGMMFPQVVDRKDGLQIRQKEAVSDNWQGMVLQPGSCAQD